MLQLSNTAAIAGSSGLTLAGGVLQLRNDTNNAIFATNGITLSGPATIDVDKANTGVYGTTLQLAGAVSTGGNALTFTNNGGLNGYNLSLGTATSSAGQTFTNNMNGGTAFIAEVVDTANAVETITFSGTSATAVTSVALIPNDTLHNKAVSVTQSGSGTLVLTAPTPTPARRR